MGKPFQKWTLGRQRVRWEDKIKLEFMDIGCEDGEWVTLFEDCIQWRAVILTGVNSFISIIRVAH
jgi:hypothetical protein